MRTSIFITMWIRIYVFLYWWIIFFSQINYLISKAMIGENVRRVREGEFLAGLSIMRYTNEDFINEHDHLCNGVLVTRTHFLTAAHCMKDEDLSEIQIIVGSRNLRCGLRYFMLWWISYNKWLKHYNIEREFRKNDIAVGKLTENVEDYINIPNLSDLTTNELYGSTVKAVAWGTKASGELTKHLKEVDLIILTTEECLQRMEIVDGVRYNLTKKYLCSAAEPYAILRPGDSGAPIYYDEELVGIHQATCPLPDTTFHQFLVNLHASIDYYRNFILHVTDSSFHWD